MLGELKSFQRRLLAWYRRCRRDLPWRPPPGDSHLPDPYFVLVSEAMLQQTQVATVIPYFRRFIERWPNLGALAAADGQEVLRLWQGLGYYSRARNLQAAARAIVERFDGQVPAEVDALRSLPGIGRYTAGAIASIAFDQPAPIVDGNVIRVLCRLDRIETDPRQDREALERLWARAEAILPRRHCGDFNSGLMELGATVCLPRLPRCLTCPVRAHCAAAEAGVQEQIPPPRKARPTPLHQRWTFCLRWKGRYLIEQRPSRGRWAGMWQFVTIEKPEDAPTDAPAPTPAAVGRLLGLRVRAIRPLGLVEHGLTHRRYTFDAFHGELASCPAVDAGRRLVTLAELDDYPLPRPQLRIRETLESSCELRVVSCQ